VAEYFENTLKTGEFYFKYAIGKSALRGREFHEYDEMVYYMGGNACLVTRSAKIPLSPRTLIFIPRETFHQFIISDEDSYKRCILQYSGDGHVKRFISSVSDGVKVVTAISSNTQRIFEFLMRMSKCTLTDEEKRELLSATLTELLLEQKFFGEEGAAENTSVSNLTLTALDYIDKNYGSHIDISRMAKELKASVSNLAHTFKSDLSISIYKYVTEKRLSSVRAMVGEGKSLYNAAIASGFSDYSAFFRHYKKHYGESPTKRTKNNENAQSGK
jgi:AraC-like DNA-binding protein